MKGGGGVALRKGVKSRKTAPGSTVWKKKERRERKGLGERNVDENKEGVICLVGLAPRRRRAWWKKRKKRSDYYGSRNGLEEIRGNRFEGGRRRFRELRAGQGVFSRG